MHAIRDLAAIWRTDEYAIIWRATPNGLAFLRGLMTLPREVRQALLRDAVEAMDRVFKAGGNPNTEDAAMLIFPLRAISPFVAEMPAESLITIGTEYAGHAPELDPETAVRVAAAAAVQGVWDLGEES